MSASINTILTRLAAEYYISSESPEAKRIEASLNHLKVNIGSYFDNAVIEVIEFGSYKRDTILPRNIDANRDVDLMIIFDHSSIKVHPITYREYLQDFSDFYYPNSTSFKSKPTVVLELNHLKYDLVPAYLEKGIFSNSLYIPESDIDWMETDPYGFNESLMSKNKKNKFLIKPLIRLLKAWNAKAGYPIQSFDLENEIVDTTYFFLDTLEEYFFDAIESLSSSYESNRIANKINALKENAEKVKAALERDNERQALTWLAHILPT